MPIYPHMHHFNIRIKDFCLNLSWEAFSCSALWSWVYSVIKILLPVSPRCWDYKLLPSCLAKSESRNYPLSEALSLSQHNVVMGAGVGVKQENKPYMDCFHWGKPFSVLYFSFLMLPSYRILLFSFWWYICMCACGVHVLCFHVCGMSINCRSHILTTLQSKSLHEPKSLNLV